MIVLVAAIAIPPHRPLRRGVMRQVIERKTCKAVDGVEIVYSVAGAGEPALVFIHGGLADRAF